jgi:hypothetical protein
MDIILFNKSNAQNRIFLYNSPRFRFYNQQLNVLRSKKNNDTYKQSFTKSKSEKNCLGQSYLSGQKG